MNILIIHSHPINDDRIKRHIKFLLKNNYEVYHLHLTINQLDNECGEFFNLGEKATRINFDCHKNNFLRYFDYLGLGGSSLVSDAFSRLNHLNFDPKQKTIIHVHDPFCLPLAIKIKEKIKNGFIVYDRHELYEKLKTFCGISGYSFFEIYAKRYIDGLVVVSKQHEDNGKMLFPNIPISIVPNYPMSSEYNDKRIEDKINNFLSNGIAKFVYIGSLNNNLDRDINLIINIFRELLLVTNAIKFYIGGQCTDVDLLTELNELTNQYPDQFYYLGKIHRETAIKITQDANFGFFLIKPNSHYWVPSSPNKVFEYMICGVIPITRADICEINQYTEDFLIFSRSTPNEKIITDICSLLKDPHRLIKLMRKARFESKGFLWENVANNYLKLYSGLRN